MLSLIELMQNKSLLTCLTCLLLLGLGPQRSQCQEWPTRTWRESRPFEEGVDERILQDLHMKFEEGIYGQVDSMLVIRNGAIIWEKTYQHDYSALLVTSAGASEPPGPYNYHDPQWHPFYKGSDLHSLQSISKSVTSALVGIAMMRRELPKAQVSIQTYLSRQERVQWSDLSFEDLLTMKSGIDWKEDVPYQDSANTWAAMEKSEDWLAYVFSRPMADPPGTEFDYNSGNTILLAHILRVATGMQADEYARRFLFEPLGIQEQYWKISPSGLPDAQGGLYLKARDLAKIGYLYLRDGIWEERRLLPEGWVGETMKPAAETDGLKYGYHWWLIPYEKDGTSHLAWACLGYGGQRMYVLPQENLIAVFTGWNIYGEPHLSAQDALNLLVSALGK